MATHIISILNSIMVDTSGSVFFEPSSVKDTNDLYPHLVVIFNDSGTKISIRGKVRVPQNYIGTAVILAVWRTTATTGNLVLDFDYRAIAAGETADPTTDQEAVTVTDAAAGTAMFINEAEMALTSANLAVGDELLYSFSRDGASASDTLAAAAILEGLYLKYNDV